jgi:PTS system fructose-specific IIC component/PTS system nitrogen regulatory IIA component
MSTGIKKGIAIPHAKTNAVDRIYGILGISKKGIDYDALDGQNVYLFFMVIIPPDDSGIQIRLLKRLAELLNNPQFYTELVAQNDPQSANGVIRKYEDIYITSE